MSSLKTPEQLLLSLLGMQLNRGHLLSIEDIQKQFSTSPSIQHQILNKFKQIDNFTLIKDIIIEHAPFEEIIFHSPQQITIKKPTSTLTTNLDIPSYEFNLMLEIFIFKQQQNWSFSNPFLSITWFFQQQQFRLSFLHSSLSIYKSHKLFIRSTPTNSLHTQHFISNTSPIITAIEQDKNIIIAGANSSGKTTFIKTLLPHLPPTDHLIILEDFAELQTNRTNTTHIIASEDTPNHSMQKICSNILRMACDRFILGEIRSTEIIPLFLAMNTGLKGVISTIHANSAKDTINRLATLFALYTQADNIPYSYILQLICQNIDMIIYLQNKTVNHIIEVKGFSDGHPLIKVVGE